MFCFDVKFRLVFLLKIFLEILVTVSADTKGCYTYPNSRNFGDYEFSLAISLQLIGIYFEDNK